LFAVLIIAMIAVGIGATWASRAPQLQPYAPYLYGLLILLTLAALVCVPWVSGRFGKTSKGEK